MGGRVGCRQRQHGSAAAPFLTPGSYSVKVELAGFSPVEQKGIKVSLGKRYELSFTLKVGDLQEVVEVVGAAPVIDTNSTTAGNKLREQTQALVQQNWKAIGVDMQINNMPAAVVWGEYYVKSKYDSLLVGVQAIIGDDPDCLNRIHSKYIQAETGSGRNVLQYKNPQVDKLLEDGVKEVDRAKRRPLYLKLQEVIRADLPYLPLFSYVRLEGVKQGMVNYKPNSNTLHRTIWSSVSVSSITSGEVMNSATRYCENT